MIAKAQANAACPEWTEYRKNNGLDPLGMQNSSINTCQALLPGISNVTLRMRYYGLYAWLGSGQRMKAHRDGCTDVGFCRGCEGIRRQGTGV